VDAGSFLLAAVVIALIGRPALGARTATTSPSRDAAEPHEPFLAAIGGGIRAIAADRALTVTMLISLGLHFALHRPVMVGLPWLTEHRFDAGPAGLGVLAASWAAGALVGVVVAGSIRLDRQGRILLAAVVVSGVMAILVGVLSSFAGAWLALAAMGVAIG